MSYSISFLCSIRKLFHVSYASFMIQREVRSGIIDLGISKQPGEWQLYRRSRVGCKLFSKIHAITSKKFSNTKAMTTTGINLKNLQYPSIRLILPIPRAKALTISHVNVISIQNKIFQFQQVVLEENRHMCNNRNLDQTWWQVHYKRCFISKLQRHLLPKIIRKVRGWPCTHL